MRFKIVFLLSFLRLLSQDTSLAKKASVFERYFNFMQKDPQQKNTFILASYNFMYTNTGMISHGGRGTYVSLGINVARLFSKKFVLGLNIEKKMWKGLWKDNLSSNYVSDFNSNFSNTLTVPEDSARAEVLKNCINGSDRYERRGTFYGAYGIMFSPFPDKWGGFMLSAKKLGFGFPVHGTFGSLFNPHGTDWLSFSSGQGYRMELICKPLTFFKEFGENRDYGAFQVSIFYQKLSWKEADFDGLQLNRIMNPAFMSKYSSDQYIGLTVKVGWY